MDTFLLNPNVAYLTLVLGLFLAILAILTPGTGLIEIGAFFTLLLAGWAVYNLPINFWALALLAASVIFFIPALQKRERYLMLALSILAMVIGSTFLFRGETGWRPAVHPLLAAIVSILMIGFIWIAGRRVMEARLTQPAHNLATLVGAIGEAKSDILAEGSVQVAGELWSARSQQPIPTGSTIRVTGREGFILDVESTNQHQA